MFDKLAAIIDRLMKDPAFYEQCENEPALALAQYQLTNEEAEALRIQLSAHDEVKRLPSGRVWH